MNVINIQQAKTHLSRYVEEVASGAEVIIGKAGKPLARLVPYQPEGKPRVGGQLKGRVAESADCWDADDELSASISSPLLHAAPIRKADRKGAKGRGRS